MGKVHKSGTNYSALGTNNIYRAFLQREPDVGGFNANSTQPFGSVLSSIRSSPEYNQLCIKKLNNIQLDFNKKINYTIIKIDNRADETTKLIHDTLSNDFIYNDGVEFVNYKIHNINDFYESRGIKINWVGDLFGLKQTTSDSELAITASFIKTLEHTVDNNLDEMIVFEDDVLLNDRFLINLSNLLKDLPDDYDFLADATIEPHYEELVTEEKSCLIGSDFICRSYLQNAHCGFMLFSNKGARTILEAYRKFGVICAIDTFLFWLSRRDDLNGYTTFHSNKLLECKDIYGTSVTESRTL